MSYRGWVGRKRQNTVIWGRGSKIAKKTRRMIFERSLLLTVLSFFTESVQTVTGLS